MEILLLLVMCMTNVACFVIGARVGQKTARGETIEALAVNPMQAVREHRARKEAQMEQDRMEVILRNIESYDGTEHGQEDVPGR